MKTKTIFCSAIIACMFVAKISSQQISPQVLTSYPPSVCVRVYDIATKVRLIDSKQLKLASMIAYEDSLMVAAMLSGQSTDSIAGLQGLAIKLILTKNEIKALEAARAKQKFARWEAYYQQQMAQLDSIKPVDPKRKKMMYNVFLNLCNRPGIQNPVENFTEAMQYSIKDTIYYAALSRAQVHERASRKAASMVDQLQAEKKVDKQSANKVFHLYRERERQLAVVDLAYPANTPEKKKLKEQIISRFDSVMNGFVGYKPADIPSTSYFASTIKNKKYFNLSDAQVDSLAKKAFELDKTRKEYNEKSGFNRFNTTEYEITHLKQILTEDQFNKFLIIKNKQKAKNVALRYWQEIRMRNIDQGLDSAQTVRQMENYELAKYVAREQNAGDVIKQEENLKAIKQNEPPIYKTIYRARKNGSLGNGAAQNTDQVIW